MPRPRILTGRAANGAFRSLPGGPEGLLADPVAGTRLGKQELVLLPRSRLSRWRANRLRRGGNPTYVCVPVNHHGEHGYKARLPLLSRGVCGSNHVIAGQCLSAGPILPQIRRVGSRSFAIPLKNYLQTLRERTAVNQLQRATRITGSLHRRRRIRPNLPAASRSSGLPRVA
jgi:hypothetical protein